MSFTGLLGSFGRDAAFKGAMRGDYLAPAAVTQDEDKELWNQGLLQAGLAILAANDGRGFGQAVSQGLLSGLGSYQQGKSRLKAEKRDENRMAMQDLRMVQNDLHQQEQARREQERFGMQQQQWQREQERQEATQKALAGITATPGTPQWAQQMALAAQAQGDAQSAARFGAMADPRIANAGREGQTLNTTAGVLTFGNGKWQPLVDPSTGKPYMSSSSLGYDPVLAQQIAASRAAGSAIGEAGAKSTVANLEGAANAEKILPLIPQVRDLIGKSTGSALGATYDAAAGMFGKSTDGAQAIAALKPLTSKFLMSVPRFEGPQGVMDVEIYKQAAGQLDNPSVPRETRLAALQTIEDLHRKYAQLPPTLLAPLQGGGGADQGSQNSQWRIVR